MPDIRSKKRELRKEMLRERAVLDKEQKRVWDLRIRDLFLESGLLSAADAVYCYYSTDEEIDTREIMEAVLLSGKRVACPRVEERGQMRFYYITALSDCCPGFRGICEPVKGCVPAEDEGALLILPGLAFSLKGARLGYGGGYYDRFLSKEAGHTTLALAYDLQVRDDVPMERSDVPEDILLTPGGLTYCSLLRGAG